MNYVVGLGNLIGRIKTKRVGAFIVKIHLILKQIL